MPCDIHDEGHVPTQITFRGKPDSFFMACSCGKIECVGTWWKSPPPGWVCHNWAELLKAGECLIKSVQDFRLGENVCKS